MTVWSLERLPVVWSLDTCIWSICSALLRKPPWTLTTSYVDLTDDGMYWRLSEDLRFPFSLLPDNRLQVTWRALAASAWRLSELGLARRHPDHLYCRCELWPTLAPWPDYLRLCVAPFTHDRHHDDDPRTHWPNTRDVMQVHNVMIIRHIPVTPLPDLTLGSTPISVLCIFNVFCICVIV